MEHYLDLECPLELVQVHKSSSGIIYSCTLNQVDIEHNNNKFYIIQILVDNLKRFYLYFRYGRVGEKGKSHHVIFHNEHVAVKNFQKRFRSKTGNIWSGDPKKFVKKPGKYMLMITEAPIIKEEINQNVSSNLDLRVNNFVSLISDKKLMISTMKKFDVDTKRLPLGKISASQIEQAHEILKNIEKWIGSDLSSLSSAGISDPVSFINKNLVRLSSLFWTLIPYSCGRNPPPVISKEEQIEKYKNLLEIFENLDIANEIFYRANNVDDIYNSLETQIIPIEKDGEEWNMTLKYVKNSHGPTHDYTLELLELFRIEKLSQDKHDHIGYFDSLSDHKLLFHGSRTANYMGLLSEGLRIPKPIQVFNGSVLGLGCYFANSVSKSFNYCNHRETDNIGFVVLCEVALGSNPQIVTRPTRDIRPTVGYTSRIAKGSLTPDPEDVGMIQSSSGKDIEVPYGILKPSSVPEGSFQYDEFVIYDKRQYRFRYLLKLKCTE